MSDKNRKDKLPSKSTILEYWVEHTCESYLATDFDEAIKRCWRCSYKTSELHRCHIIPESLNGKPEPQNLVLLCKRCHEQAPNVKDKEFMFSWIHATKIPHYDFEFKTKNDNIFELIYKRSFLVELIKLCELKDISEIFKQENIKNKIKSIIFSKTGNHYGQGLRSNQSTRAWVLNEVEKIFIKELKIKVPKDFITKPKKLTW